MALKAPRHLPKNDDVDDHVDIDINDFLARCIGHSAISNDRHAGMSTLTWVGSLARMAVC